jgi:hypothetical protein
MYIYVRVIYVILCIYTSELTLKTTNKQNYLYGKNSYENESKYWAFFKQKEEESGWTSHKPPKEQKLLRLKCKGVISLIFQFLIHKKKLIKDI